MRINAEAKIGIIITASVLIFVFGISFLKEYDFGKNGYMFYAKFETVSGLNEGDAISISGVKVGKVKKIHLNGKNVIAELWINGDIVLPADSKISIVSTSLLGEKHIGIFPGNLSTVVSGEDTLEGTYEKDIAALMPEIESLMNNIKDITKTINMALNDSLMENLKSSVVNIRKVTNNLQQVIRSERKNVAEILANTNKASKTINTILTNNQGKVDSIVSEFTQHSKKTAVLSKLDSTAFLINNILAKIDNNNGTLGKIVNDQHIYKTIDSLATNINGLVSDFKKNPKKYINVSVF